MSSGTQADRGAAAVRVDKPGDPWNHWGNEPVSNS